MLSYGKLAANQLRRQWRRTAVTLLGVVLSMGLIIGTGTVMTSVQARLVASAMEANGSYHLRIGGVTPELARDLLAESFVETGGALLAPREVIASMVGPDGEGFPALLQEMTPGALSLLKPRIEMQSGNLPRATGDTLVPEIGVAGTGETLSIWGADPRPTHSSSTSETFEISGVYTPQFQDSRRRSPELLTLRNDLPQDAPVTLLLQLADIDLIPEGIEGILADYRITREEIAYNDRLLSYHGKGPRRDIRRAFHLFHGVVLTIILLSTGALLFNSFSISLAERKELIGTLRCVGATPAQVRRLLLSEAYFYVVLGIPLGALASRGALELLFSVVRRMSVGNELVELLVVSPPSVYAVGAILGGVTILSAALLPAQIAARQPPVDAARGTPVAAVNVRAPKTVPRHFERVRARCMLLFIGSRNLRRAPVQSGVTVFSLSISVLLVVCFGGLLRLSVEANVLPDPNQPEIVVRNEEGLASDVIRELSREPAVAEAYLYDETYVQARVPEKTLSPTYRQNVEAPLFTDRDGMVTLNARLLFYGDEAYEEWRSEVTSSKQASGERAALLVGRSAFSDSRDVTLYGKNVLLSPGERVVVQSVASEKRQSVSVEGVLESAPFDNYNPDESAIDLIVRRDQFLALAERCEPKQLFLKLRPEVKRDTLLTRLDRIVLDDPEYSFISAEAIARRETQNFRAVALFFYGFMSVIALIGAVNVANTLAARLVSRRGEVGTLRSIGLDQAQATRVIVWEAALLALAAFVLGSVLGTLLWYIQVEVVGLVRGVENRPPWREIGIAALGLAAMVLPGSYMSARGVVCKSIVSEIRRRER